MLTLNTQILFKILTKAMQPHNVLDIGSMDGSDALMLKKLSTASKCFAFEANPYNFNSMNNDPRLSDAGVELINKAVADQSGVTSFFIARQSDDSVDWRRGTSSLLKRDKTSDDIEEVEVQVESITLNEFLQKNCLKSCAIWVDVEGAAYQVLKGADRVANHIIIGHVEVETSSVWADQKDAISVLDLLDGLGFCTIARGGGKNQHDIVFVRKEIANKFRLKCLLYAAFIVSRVRKYFGKLIFAPIFLFVMLIIPKGLLSHGSNKDIC